MSNAVIASAIESSSGFSPRKRVIALIVVALAFVMDLLDATIINIALPSVQSDLGASYSSIQWLVSGYLLAFATLLITGGRLGDIFGYKKMFLAGVGGFTLASLICGIAQTPSQLIGARVFQGAMAALMVPQVMSVMQVMYRPSERTNVLAIFGALGGLAASSGPILGGLLIKANLFGLDWRPIFLINIPVGILALVAGAQVLPRGKSVRPLRLDWPGTALIVTALSLIVFPLVQGRELDWPAWIFGLLGLSLPLLAGFGWYQRRRMQRDGSALVVPHLFTHRSFSGGLLVNIIFQMVMISFFFIFTLLLQAGLGYDVLKAALTGLPTAFGIALSVAALGRKLIPVLGRYLLTLGSLTTALGLFILMLTVQHYGLDVTPWHFIPGLFITGAGMGSIMSCIYGIVLNKVEAEHAGAASGILNAVQQLGGALGVALIGVIFFGQLTSHASQSVAGVVPEVRSQLAAANIPQAAQAPIIAGLETCFKDRATQKDNSIEPESCKWRPAEASAPAMPQVGTLLAQAGKKANQNNFTHAFQVSTVFQWLCLAVIFGLSFFLPRHFKTEEELA